MRPLHDLNSVIDRVHRFFDRDWVYSPQGWIVTDKSGKNASGWYNESVERTQMSRWPLIVESLRGTGPLTTAFTTVPPESTRKSGALKAHNTIMSYAYALSRARGNKNSLFILDWGGGVGLYHLLANVLFPDLNVEYYSYDIPSLCKLGREFWPNDVFFEEAESALGRKYDLVISSSSLHYFERWQETLKHLAKATLGYLYVARLPVVRGAQSFVAIHRVHRRRIMGYDTEFVEWIISRDELLECAKQAGMVLVREFADPDRIFVHKAPKGIIDERGFLFVPSDLTI